jgi:hypothetical protein
MPSAGGGLAAEQGHKPPAIAPRWCPRKIFSITFSCAVR